MMINKALIFATNAHLGQFRKGTNIPYIVHPIRVMERLLRLGFSEEVACGGLLHDVTEDCDVSFAELEETFGGRIASLVRNASEVSTDSGKRDASTWKERKANKINHLVDLSDKEAIAIIAADKTDNLSDMVVDFKAIGKKMWSKFNASYEEIAWFYSSVKHVLEHKNAQENGFIAPLLREMNAHWEFLFPQEESLKILYIHGFASQFDAYSEKVQTLSQLGRVEGPSLDYTKSHQSIYETLKNQVIKGGYDLIVGSSLGGYWASLIGSAFGIPFVATNPATNPSETLKKYMGKGTTHFGEPFELKEEIVLGYGRIAKDGCGLILLDEGDEVIDPSKTMMELQINNHNEQNQANYCYGLLIYSNGSHRFEHIKESMPEIRKFYERASIVYGFGGEE